MWQTKIINMIAIKAKSSDSIPSPRRFEHAKCTKIDKATEKINVSDWPPLIDVTEAD
jgi:hypothetical protein